MRSRKEVEESRQRGEGRWDGRRSGDGGRGEIEGEGGEG